MDTHLSRGRDRRSKGRTRWPEVYLVVEFIVLLSMWYVVYLLGHIALTILVGLVVIYAFITSSIPRYRRVVARQERKKVINNTHKISK
jgi:Flp pilus assembly protein TadB